MMLTCAGIKMSMMDSRSFEYPAILFGDQTSFYITSKTPSVHLLPVVTHTLHLALNRETYKSVHLKVT